MGAEQRAMKKSGVRRGVLVYKGPDPAAKMKIPASIVLLIWMVAVGTLLWRSGFADAH